MKISMKLTERDRKLLTTAAFLAVLAVMSMRVLYPLHVTIWSLKKQIENYELQMNEMEQKTQELGTMRALAQKKQEEWEVVQSQLFPEMSSQKIDQLLTEKAVQCGLTVWSFQVVTLEEGTDLGISGQEKKEEREVNGQTGICTARVKLAVSGTEEGIEEFLDAVSEQLGGIRVTVIDWEPPYEARKGDGMAAGEQQTISMELELVGTMKQKGG